MKRISVRAIINYDDGIILIHRVKSDHDYYVFPGGGIENNESYEECISREVIEELGIIIEPKKELYTVEDDKSIAKFYLCSYVSGELGSGIGPEFSSEDYSGTGEYIPVVIKLEDFNKLNIFPTKIKENLLNGV